MQTKRFVWLSSLALRVAHLTVSVLPKSFLMAAPSAKLVISDPGDSSTNSPLQVNNPRVKSALVALLEAQAETQEGQLREATLDLAALFR